MHSLPVSKLSERLFVVRRPENGRIYHNLPKRPYSILKYSDLKL